MGIKAKAIRTLYKAKRITLDGVKQAVVNKIISENEYELITGQIYLSNELQINRKEINNCD